MLAACREIRAYLGRSTLDDFLADSRTLRAVERCFEILGEAARAVSEEFRSAHPEIPWRKLVGLRNVISHEYGDVDYEGIFAIASESVPELTRALEAIVQR